MRLIQTVNCSILLSALLSTVLLAQPALAKQPLGTISEVSDGLLTVGIADEIRNNCPDISARMFRALSYISGIKSHAKSLGYSSDEINAYRKDEVEKAKLRARGESYLQANGVTRDDPQTFCTLGRAEIKKSSQIGALLKAK